MKNFAQPMMRSLRTRYSMIGLLAIVALLLGLPELAVAQTGGLTRTTSTMEQLRDWLWLIIPVVCLIAGGILGALYSLDIIRKDTLYTWVGGVIFSGLVAGGIIELVF